MGLRVVQRPADAVGAASTARPPGEVPRANKHWFDVGTPNANTLLFQGKDLPPPAPWPRSIEQREARLSCIAPRKYRPFSTRFLELPCSRAVNQRLPEIFVRLGFPGFAGLPGILETACEDARVGKGDGFKWVKRGVRARRRADRRFGRRARACSRRGTGYGRWLQTRPRQIPFVPRDQTSTARMSAVPCYRFSPTPSTPDHRHARGAESRTPDSRTATCGCHPHASVPRAISRDVSPCDLMIAMIFAA